MITSTLYFLHDTVCIKYGTWLMVLAEHEHSMVPTDARAHVMAENSPGARL